MGRFIDRLTSMRTTFTNYSVGSIPSDAAYAALNPEFTTMQLRRTFGSRRRAYNLGVLGARAANVAPTVANAISTQSAARNTLWTFAFAENTFADLQPAFNVTTLGGAVTNGRRYVIVSAGTTDFTLIGAANSNVGTFFTKNSTVPLGTGTVRVADVLTYTATLQDGNPLPGWLTFTPATRTFSGTSPNVVQSYLLRAIATDPFGSSVNANFTFNAT